LLGLRGKGKQQARGERGESFHRIFLSERDLPIASHAVSIKGGVDANHWQLLDHGLRDD
jgi:hypothetical protein